MIHENRSKLPQIYMKHVAQPKCEETVKAEKFLNHCDKSHEKEIERQACEYAKYKLDKDLIRKQIETRLIQEKVQKNIEKAEKSAAILVQMRSATQKISAHDYDALKEKWENENQEKKERKKVQRQELLDKVYKDFNEIKGMEKCNWKIRDVSRLWALERLVAVENYEQECERKNLRRQTANEIALYNAALTVEKKCPDERQKKHLDNKLEERGSVKISKC